MARAAATRALVAAGLATAALPSAMAKPQRKGDNVGIRLHHLSFERTLTYDDTLGDWLSSASTMALRDRVQLMPPVADRRALFWSKPGVSSRDFEVSFTVSGRVDEDAKVNLPESDSGKSDGMLVFWISLDNYSASFNEQSVIGSGGFAEGMKAAGLTFVGNKPNFRGLAVVFAGDAAAAKGRQSVTGIWNDGAASMPEGEVPVDGPDKLKQTQWLDWLSGSTQVKIRVTPRSIQGWVKTLDLGKHFPGTIWGWATDGETVDYDLTFELDHSVKSSRGSKGHWDVLMGNRVKLEMDGVVYTMRAEGGVRAVLESSEPPSASRPVMLYGGQGHVPNQDEWSQVFALPLRDAPFTMPADAESFYLGFTGYTGTKSWLEVDLHRLETTDFAARGGAEDLSDVFRDGSSKRWLEVMEREKRFIDQASQKEAVEKLTKLLKDHITGYDKLGEQLKKDLVALEGRLDNLGADVGSYLQVVSAWDAENNKFNPQAVTAHIQGIKTMLSSHGDRHSRKLEEVNRAAQALKAVQSSSGGGKGAEKIASAADQSRAVEEFAAKGSFQTDVLLVVIVVVVAGLGLLFFNRMRYYEKKHVI